MQIGTKIRFGLGLILTLILVLYLAFYSADQQNRASITAIQEANTRALLASEIESVYTGAVLEIRRFIADGENDNRHGFIEKMNQVRELEDNLLKKARPEKRAVAEKLINDTDIYYTGVRERLIPAIIEGQVAKKQGDLIHQAEAEALSNAITKELTPFAQRLQKTLSTIVEDNSTVAKEQVVQSEANSEKSRFLIMALGGVLLLIGIFLSLILTRMVTHPVKMTKSYLNTMARGDYGVTIDQILVSRKDEFGGMGQSLEDMRCRFISYIQEKDELIFETNAQKEEIESYYQQMVALNQELENAYQEKSMAYVETIKALADAIEAKDDYTRGHSDRVLCYAKALGEKMALPAEEMHLLSYAAILHDVGKIGISLNVINKPGKLTPDEYQRIQRHPMIGYKILSNITSLHGVALAVLQHHERIDGKGYPQGLTGDQIIISAKILAISDTYDAMTSSRPYRQALSWQEACAEIRLHAGTQFSYEMAHIFCEMVEENPEAFGQ